MKLGMSELMMLFQEEYDNKIIAVRSEISSFLKNSPAVSMDLRVMCISPKHEDFRKMFTVHAVDADRKEVHLMRNGNLQVVSAKDFDKNYDLPNNQSERDNKRDKNSRKDKNEK